MTDSIQPDVPTLLLQHRDCLANYRQLSTQWYGGMLAAEQKFSAGDSAITRSIESKGAVTRYALCKKDGTLTLIHAFEQFYAAVVDVGVDVFAVGLNLTDMTKIVLSHYF